MHNIKIADWEYLYAEQILIVYLQHLDEAMNSFARIMDRVQTEAIDDGEDGILIRCQRYGEQMKALKQMTSNLQEVMKGRAQRFVEEIDKADQFVYGR